MRPLPLIAAVAILALLALRYRTLSRTVGAAGVLAAAALAAYGLGTYSLPSLNDALTRIAPALGNWTYVLVPILAYLESAAFIGLFVPGEMTVVLGGAISRGGEISIGRLFVLVWIAAAAGDTTGYILGRKLGRGFLTHHGPRFHITPNVIARVETIFNAHGGKAIVVGRFVGVARAITPFLAGTSHIPFRRFIAFDIVGAAAWAAAFLGVGYLVAASLDRVAELSHSIGFGIAAAAAAGACALGLRQLFRSTPRGERLGVALRWVRIALIPAREVERPDRVTAAQGAAPDDRCQADEGAPPESGPSAGGVSNE
jgi:membrane protein DedA with SNARE-associated domain